MSYTAKFYYDERLIRTMDCPVRPFVRNMQESAIQFGADCFDLINKEKPFEVKRARFVKKSQSWSTTLFVAAS